MYPCDKLHAFILVKKNRLETFQQILYMPLSTGKNH